MEEFYIKCYYRPVTNYQSSLRQISDESAGHANTLLFFFNICAVACGLMLDSFLIADRELQ